MNWNYYYYDIIYLKLLLNLFIYQCQYINKPDPIEKQHDLNQAASKLLLDLLQK